MPRFTDRQVWGSIHWKATFLMNLQRVIAGSLVWCVILLISPSIRIGANEAFSMVFLPVGGMLLVMIALIANWMNHLGLSWALMFAMPATIIAAPGDPLIFILSKINPQLVPVIRPGFFNFRSVILVFRDQ